MLPASAVPVKIGVTTLVMLSALEKPLSDAASRSGLLGVAGVAEDHAPYASCVEGRSHASHIVGESRRRNCSVLDELHRLENRIEGGQHRTGGVAKLPYLVLFAG